MSVRRLKRRDPITGQTRESWMVDVDFEHADGRRERVRKISTPARAPASSSRSSGATSTSPTSKSSFGAHSPSALPALRPL